MIIQSVKSIDEQSSASLSSQSAVSHTQSQFSVAAIALTLAGSDKPPYRCFQRHGNNDPLWWSERRPRNDDRSERLQLWRWRVFKCTRSLARGPTLRWHETNVEAPTEGSAARRRPFGEWRRHASCWQLSSVMDDLSLTWKLFVQQNKFH